MNHTFEDYNIIPIGDHCTTACIIKELGIRTKSYPFDWVTHREQIHDTNILYNIELVQNLTTNNVQNTVNMYIGNALTKHNNINDNNNIWFPHESGTTEYIYEKYIRRFTRLHNDLKSQKNICILLTRHYYIDEPTLKKIRDTLCSFNDQNIILFISGTDHPYLTDKPYTNVIFKHIMYDIERAFNYDNEVFRPLVKEYLHQLFL